MKRALSVVLCFVFVLLSVPFSALPAAADTYGDFLYEIENGEATITRYTGDGGDVTIPSRLGEHPVTRIKRAFYDCTSLTSITIPDSVTSIGDYAFYYCYNLTSVTIPGSVTSIGDYAFAACTSLTGIAIPEGVTSIGDFAFSDCTSLTNITIPDSVTSIGEGAFQYCTSLTSITVDKNNPFYHSSGNCIIETARKTLVAGCKNSVIPSDGSVTSIGALAFTGRTSLTSITIPGSVTSICQYAFYDCTSLTNAIIGNGVTSIGDHAFSFCESLTSITIPGSVTSIGARAFYVCTRLTSITIPGSVTSIGEGAFSGCTSLTSITVDKNNPIYHSSGNCIIETASKTLVAGCKNSVIPSDGSVTSIGKDAFSFCESLTSITIPGSVTSIGARAFYVCTRLTGITIPGSVTSIGRNAFEWCESLTSVYYAGTEKQWAAIKIDAYNEPLTNATIVVHWGTKPPDPEDQTCRLDELTSLDYLAFAAAAGLDIEAADADETIKTVFGQRWNDKWSFTDYTNEQLYSHIANWRVLCFKNTSGTTGFTAIAFVNDDNEAVITFEGSNGVWTFDNIRNNPDWFNDWIANDINMYLGGNGAQVQQALDFYDEVLEKICDPDKIHITGHSLGGGLGDIVSCYSGSYAETFNAAPFIEIAYRYYPEYMGKRFGGIDEWNFFDHVNINDTLIGVMNLYHKNYILHDKQGYLKGVVAAHLLESFIIEKTNGKPSKPELTPHFNAVRTDVNTRRVSLVGKMYLGNSYNDSEKELININGDIFYGGNGNDFFHGSIAGDDITGGRGDDLLYGDYGDDFYYFFKGDGHDTIMDSGGHDTLCIIGFGSDVVKVDVYDDYIYLYFSKAEDTIKISRSHGLINNSFYVFDEAGKQIYNISDLIKGKSTYARFTIGCPVTVDIVDASGNIVYTVPNEVGVYENDYGVYYVYEDAGETVRDIYLVENYLPVINGDDSGEMNVYYMPAKAGEEDEQKVFSAISVNVTENTVAKFSISDDSAQLLIDGSGSGTFSESLELSDATVTIKVVTNNKRVEGAYNVERRTIKGDNIELNAAFDPEHEFLGWYNGNELLSEDSYLVYSPQEDAVITAKYITHVPGDVNGNGKIDSQDYAMTKRAFLKTYTLTDEQLMRADINGNGKVDSSEYAMIKRHFLKTYVIPGAEGK